ncbi:hypothetical protein WR25_23869 isoform B [Diploscapter pachys]|nr:hypothetical protein WR25_23869 isoform B [Diploscapter pachys]
MSKSLKRVQTYVGRIAKPANFYIRWNLLFTFLIFLFISSAIWVPCIPAVNDFALEIVTIVCIILHLLWAIAVFNALRYTYRLRKFAHHKIDLDKLNTDFVTVKHVVGLCIYKEPQALIMDTIDSIARKCSNFNYASRQAIKILRRDKDYPLGRKDKKVEVLVTTGDCDSIFGERYFDALEEDYWKISPEQRTYTVWQSPLFYCMNLDKSPFFVRVTGLLRAFFMIGYLIPWNINTMSIFSLTLKLLEDGEYTHPSYQMDDIIALIRWSLAVRRRCVIRAIPVATLSGPTSGKNYCDEWYEWARQIRRWTIGAAEVFHYFAIKFFRLPAMVSFSFACKFVFYYGFLLCIASVYTIVAPSVTPAMLEAIKGKEGVKGLVYPNGTVFMIVMLSFLGLQYFWFFCVFLVSYLCQPVFPNKTKDKTGIIRNIFHFIMTWPTITMYCVVELVAFLEVTVRGKAVCSHNASKKDNLVAPVSNVPDRFEV